MNTDRPETNTPHSNPYSLTKRLRLTPEFSSIKPTYHSDPSHSNKPISNSTKSIAGNGRLEFQHINRKISSFESSRTTITSEAGDRFIPVRTARSSSSSMEYDFEGFKANQHQHHSIKSLEKMERNRLLYQTLMVKEGEDIRPKNILKFSRKRRQCVTRIDPFSHDILRQFHLSDSLERFHPAKKPRRSQDIPKKAFRVLDAPGLRDDFYLHLLSWSKADVLAVALDHSVYLRSEQGKSITRLMSMQHDDHVTCVSWNLVEHQYLAIASKSGVVFVYDTIHAECIVKLKVPQAHQDQSYHDFANVMAWNGSILSAGGRQGRVYFWNLEVARRECFKVLHPHRANVCSLAWHVDRTQFASGGNDNLVLLHDIRNFQAPLHVLCGHSAAVKALSWCPFQRDTLVTGGGRHDNSIKIWKSTTGDLKKSIDTGDQVCTFEWNPLHEELISASGYLKSELVFWQFPHMKRIAELKYHTNRILYTAMSPDYSTIITGGGDERLALWQVNPRYRLNSGTSGVSLFPESLHRPIR